MVGSGATNDVYISSVEYSLADVTALGVLHRCLANRAERGKHEKTTALNATAA